MLMDVQAPQNAARSAGSPQPALRKLADLFASEWKRNHGRAGRNSCCTLEGDLLVFRLEGLLSPAELEMWTSEQGAASLRQQLVRMTDEIYPDLAEQIERKLHCYVGMLDVDVDSTTAALLISLQVRDTPVVWRSLPSLSSCEEL